MKHLDKLLQYTSKGLIYVTALCLLAMMLHVSADVILKYVISFPIPGTAEVVANYYMVATVFLPLPFVEMRNGGIFIEIFYNMVGEKGKRAMAGASYLGQLGFFLLLAYQSSLDSLAAFERLDFIEGQISVFTWPARFFLPLGFSVASLVSVLRFLQISFSPDWENKISYVEEEEPDRPIQEPI